MDATFRSAKALEGKILQNNYRLEKLVGKGGMAWVYRALHLQLQELVAVKILQPSLFDDDEIKGRFASEARVQFRMRHPHIVQVTDLIEDGTWVGIVMEWIEGENLKQLLKRVKAPLSRKDLWWVMAPILDAVGFAHQEGLVHRDIKPANILLQSKQGDVIPKVADFGIAKVMGDAKSDLTATGMTMGTLKYMAPEQVRDSKHVDHRADIYSLGVTLYMMSTLQTPFRGQQDYIIYQQLHEDPKPPSELNPRLPAAFDDVVLRCLAKEPVDRFTSCQELMFALSWSLLSTEDIPRPAEELNLFEIRDLIDALPESSSIYRSSLQPVRDSVLQPFVRGARATPFLDGSATNDPTSPDPTTLDPTASPPPPQATSESDKAKQSEDFAGSGESTAVAEPVEPTTVGSCDTLSAPEQSQHQDGVTWLEPDIQQAPATATNLDRSVAIHEPTLADVASDSPAIPAKVTASPTTSGSRQDLGPVLGLLLVVMLVMGSWLWWRPSGRAATQTTRAAISIQPVAHTGKIKPACREGETRSCYTGPASTRGVGLCRTGQKTCRDGHFGPCEKQQHPATKEACNGLDDDCDGQTDEDFAKLGKPCQLRKHGALLSGKYQCSPDRKSLICHATRRVRQLPSLRILPQRQRFRVKVGARVRSVRGRLSLNIRRRTRIKIYRRGYYSCFVRISPRHKVVTIRMRRSDPNALAPLDGYCLKP